MRRRSLFVALGVVACAAAATRSRSAVAGPSIAAAPASASGSASASPPASSASAAAPSPSASAAEPLSPKTGPDPKTLDEAKSLFRQGNELRKAGDCERAAVLFLRSRALVASVPNTLNAAYCLQHTGRMDEALELYEELLTVFRAELTDEQRQSIGPALSELRALVASIDVSGNTSGTVVIDGRARGRLPLAFPLRVLAGEHQLRVVAEGFQAFEATIAVRSGESVRVDAKMTPLVQTGRLRVSGRGLEGGDLFVDGAVVGKLPWEGSLAPGAHVIAARRGEQGAPPRTTQIVFAETVAIELAPTEIADVRVSVVPVIASISIDGVPLGRGSWQGFLPVGKHTLASSEVGYVETTRSFEVAAGRMTDVTLALSVDTSHPIWDARHAELAQRRSGERSTDELASLYFNASLFGLGTGLWIDALALPKDTRTALAPVLVFAIGMPLLVGAADSGKRSLRYGVPQGVVSGMYIGLEEGIAWSLWQGSVAKRGEVWSTGTIASVIWSSSAVGAIGGGVIATTRGSTPGRASYVGSTALWTSVFSGLLVAGVTPDAATAGNNGLLASAIGVNVGLGLGLATAGAASPSIARARYLDLGGVTGILLGMGAYGLVAGDTNARGLTIGGSIGVASGLTVAWLATRGMPKDDAPNPSGFTVEPTILPTKHGAQLGLLGAF